MGSVSCSFTARAEGMAFINCLHNRASKAESDKVGSAARRDSFKRHRKRVGSSEERRVASSNSR